MASGSDIQVSGLGGISGVVAQAAVALEKFRVVTLSGINSGIPNVVQAAELLKHRIKGLHQVNSFEKVAESNKTRVSIKLSLEQLDARQRGYQAPLPDAEVEVKSFSELQSRPPPRNPRPHEEGKEDRPQLRGAWASSKPPTSAPAAPSGQTPGGPRGADAKEFRPRGGRGGRRGGRRGDRGGRRGPAPRSDLYENYQKVRPTASAAPPVPGEIMISNRRPIPVYVKEAVLLFKKSGLTKVQLKASGMALAHAVAVAEDIRRVVRGVHQLASFGKRQVTDVYEPTKSGLENVTRERSLPTLDITLSTAPLNKADPGYQAPLPDSQVKEMTVEEAEKGLSPS